MSFWYLLLKQPTKAQFRHVDPLDSCGCEFRKYMYQNLIYEPGGDVQQYGILTW